MRRRRNPTITPADIQRDVQRVMEGRSVARGDCTLEYLPSAETYRMVDNETGNDHSLYRGATNKDRLAAHWSGFLGACGWKITADVPAGLRAKTKKRLLKATSELMNDLRMNNDLCGSALVLASAITGDYHHDIQPVPPELDELYRQLFHVSAVHDRRGYLTRPEVDEYTKLRRKLLAVAKEHYTKDSYDKIRALL